MSAPLSSLPPVVKRRTKMGNEEAKTQYRCSLINLENSQDEELDAILGELSILESQFDDELSGKLAEVDDGTLKRQQQSSGSGGPVAAQAVVAAAAPDASPTESDKSNQSSGVHSRSSSGGSNNATEGARGNRPVPTANGRRTESPDNDSAFCDNLSVVSSSSAASSSRMTDQSQSKSSSTSGISSNHHSPLSPGPQSLEADEARVKAEKIKLAIEKIKEASIKKLFIKVFTADGAAKSLLIDEKMTVGHVTRILAEKNHVKLDPKWGLVELVPDLYMERAYEDNENLVENCLMWKVDSKNTLWFIERPEKFDLFARPELYLLGTSSSQKGDLMEEHSRQELLEEYFSSSGVGAPEVEGFIWLKAENKKSWKKFYFVLRSSGLYYAPKGKKSSKDLVCLSTFDVNQVYYGAGWRKKFKAPSDFCFAIKHPQIQAKTPKYIRYLCVDTERELHQWVTGIRIAKNGRQLYDNYRAIEEEITHADIDILTSKRYSVNSPNTLAIKPQSQQQSGLPSPMNNATNLAANLSNPSSPARTPSSENKSLDSALSSGIVSDMSTSSAASATDIADSAASESESGSQNTPVNTIERGAAAAGGHYAGVNGLRRSLSRSSKSSSSSGCLSDTRSGSEHQSGGGGGFESDFPAGGTIKKRPAVNPRIPLTNTTWGLVRAESDEDVAQMESGVAEAPVGPNVRVGGGGTLLRNAVRQSFRKQPQGDSSAESLTPEPVRHHQIITAQVHAPANESGRASGDDVDPLSEQFENCFAEPAESLPPPPRDESLDHLSLVARESAMTSSIMSMDDLPPPPPEIYHEDATPTGAGIAPPPPPPPSARPAVAPLPPSLRRTAPSPPPPPKPPAISSQGKRANGSLQARVSFDDNVQLIGEGGVEAGGGLPPHLRRPVVPSPNRLYHAKADSQAAPPREFLKDLQRVMNKKWQVAKKCKDDHSVTPHAVLGFRDEDLNYMQHQSNSKEESVGAWVLQQNFNGQGMPMPPPPPTAAPHPPPPQQEPLYAMTSRMSPNGRPMHYSPSPAPAPMMAPPQPVVLREPTPPDFDPYSAPGHPLSSHPRSDNMGNYSTVRFANSSAIAPPPPQLPPTATNPMTMASPLRRPAAPPPPKRSQNTQLTSNVAAAR